MAVKGYQTQFQYGDGDSVAHSSAWTDFATIDDIKPPKVESGDIDVSHMQSPNSFKEYVAGWAEGGEFEVKIQFEKAQNATIYGLFRKPKGYRIVFPDAPAPSGSKWKADGYIKSFANEVDREGIITADIVVKITGEPDFEPAS